MSKRYRYEISFDELIEQAGSANARPPLPKEGIPKYIIPSFIRWPIRVLFVPFLILDSIAQKIAKAIISPPYRQKGFCKKRGNCCRYILLEKPKDWFGSICLFWHTQINGFYERDIKLHMHEGKEMLIMGCRYLEEEGRCSNYYFRPAICRKWPIIEHFGEPKILKDCGYYPIFCKSYRREK